MCGEKRTNSPGLEYKEDSMTSFTIIVLSFVLWVDTKLFINFILWDHFLIFWYSFRSNEHNLPIKFILNKKSRTTSLFPKVFKINIQFAQNTY